MSDKKLVLRHEVLTFMKPKKITDDTFEEKYYRLYGFTELSETANPQEYTRKYIDEARERTDIVGMTKTSSFNLDYHEGDLVHADIKKMYDKELTGTNTEREFIAVELFKDVKYTDRAEMLQTKEAREGKSVVQTGKRAILRKYTVIISDSGGEEAVTFAGSFNVSGDRIEGVAISDDGWQTCTFKNLDQIQVQA